MNTKQLALEIEDMVNEAREKLDAAIELNSYSEVTALHEYWRGLRDAHRIAKIYASQADDKTAR